MRRFVCSSDVTAADAEGVSDATLERHRLAMQARGEDLKPIKSQIEMELMQALGVRCSCLKHLSTHPASRRAAWTRRARWSCRHETCAHPCPPS